MTAFPNSTTAPDFQSSSPAINTGFSRATDISNGHSLIIAAGEEYARLMKLVMNSRNDQFESYHCIWPRIEAAEHAVLTARAATVAEGAIQAHILLCGIEVLDVGVEGEDEESKKLFREKHRLEVAAQSLRLLLSDLAGEAQPLEYRPGGATGPNDYKFRED